MTGPSYELDPDKAVSVGRIAAARGFRGELRVEPLTDFPERFNPGSKLWLDGAEVRVEFSRWHGRSVYLKLVGVDGRSAAEALLGHELQMPQAEQIEDEDVYYLHDIIGLRVETDDGETLGKIESIFSTGSNDVYVVRGERGELLLPAVEDVIKQVDITQGRVVVELLEGLAFTRPKASGNASARRRGRGTPSRKGGLSAG